MTRADFKTWLDGFAAANPRDHRAGEFLLNRFEGLIRMLGELDGDYAAACLHDMRHDFFVSEFERAKRVPK